jgi:hypothetical protein
MLISAGNIKLFFSSKTHIYSSDFNTTSKTCGWKYPMKSGRRSLNPVMPPDLSGGYLLAVDFAKKHKGDVVYDNHLSFLDFIPA